MKPNASHYRILRNESGLFAGFNEPEFLMALELANPTVMAHRKGDFIFRQEESISSLAVVCSGRLVSYKHQLDKTQLLVRFYSVGSPVAMEALISRRRTSHTTICSQHAGELLLLDIQSLISGKLLSHDLQHRLLLNAARIIANESIRFINKSTILSMRSVREKILTFLNIINTRRGGHFDIGMNQEEFAQYLGVDRSSLSATLNELRRDGIIEFNKTTYCVLK